MGKQPETDASSEEPVNDHDERVQDVEVVATLDLSLDLSSSKSGESGDYAFDPEATPLAMCQICMEFYGSQEVVRNVCGAQCLAEICPDCLVQHLTATVYAFYPGVLPKMRCPVCLVVLNKCQWKKFVVPEAITTEEHYHGEEDEDEEEEDEAEEELEEEEQDAEEPAEEEDEEEEEEEEEDEEEEQHHVDEWGIDHSHVLAKFEILCRQSCGFQAPCCHNTDYSMLSPVRESRIVTTQQLKLPTSQASHLPELARLYREYAFHRVEASELYGFLQDKFGSNAEELLETMLANTVDDERRANLLLLHLFHYPNTYTTCCDRAVCFKCKAAHHHDGNCNDFVVDENVLDCPGCRVTLVKVDGCDSVTCLCGYAIEWPREMEKQRMQRRQLVPADNREYGWWNQWTRRLHSSLSQIEDVVEELRQQKLQRMLFQHRDALQLFVDRAVRRARLNILIREQRQRLRVVVRRHLERRKGLTPKSDRVATTLAIAPAA